MASGRLINIARDKITGKLLDANILFDQSKKTESFEVRKEFNQDELAPVCLECEQELTIAHSKYDRNYFRHLPYHSYCLLSDNSLSAKEQNEYIEITKQRESNRHKYLKNQIGSLLALDANISNINIDSRYILTDTTKRKPDVYCEYNGYKIVFEIQLSKLPLWYILKRYNFYKANNIILIWILDNFNVRDQSSFERDIKYLNKYQNFFKLDEDSVDFKLICEYKEVFIENYIVKSKWTEYSVQLSELKIDQEEVQAFYYDYPAIERAKKYELIQLLRQKEEDEFNSEQERKSNERKKKATKIIESINKEKLKVNPYYKKIENDINELSYLEIQELNKQMNLKKATRPMPD